MNIRVIKKLNNKNKLILINEYVKIYRVLFVCKSLFFSCLPIETTILKNLVSTALSLKTKYEQSFAKLKMNDEAFCILKKQLDDSISYKYLPNYLETNILEKIKNQLITAKNTHTAILSKVKK